MINRHENVNDLNLEKSCMFCHASPLSKEHVWGKWLKNYYGISGNNTFRGTHTVTEYDSEMKPFPAAGRLRKNGHDLSTTAKVVCRTCNNEWMSRIDSAARNAYISINALPLRYLSKKQSSALKTWATMRALIWERINLTNALSPLEKTPYHTVAFNYFICRWLDFKKTLSPPTDVHFFISKVKNGASNAGSHNIYWLPVFKADGSVQWRSTTVLFTGHYMLVVTNIPASISACQTYKSPSRESVFSEITEKTGTVIANDAIYSDVHLDDMIASATEGQAGNRLRRFHEVV